MTNAWVGRGSAAATGTGLRFRNALLGTVAAGALSLACGNPALALPAGCSIDGTGTIETCTGNQSAGVTAAPPPVTTLDVNNLTTAITPAAGTPGIQFSSAGVVNINSNTGTFGISTTGNNADGITGLSTGGAAVTVTSTGNVSTAGTYSSGVYAASKGGGAGAVTLTSTGNIVTGNAGGTSGIGGGLFAYTLGTGAVTVTSTGDLTVGGTSKGIFAIALGGAITINSIGNISSASGAGISARGHGTDTVVSTGNVTTTGDNANAIMAYTRNFAAITVTSQGNISTAGNVSRGIYATSHGGSITVNSTGNINSEGATFAGGIIILTQGTGVSTVTSTGNIATYGTNSTAIQAAGINVSTVTSLGNLSTAGAGSVAIYARGGGAGNTVVTSTGNITTAGASSGAISAVSAIAGTGGAAVTSVGNITTAGDSSFGIKALTPGTGAATVSSTGNITTAGANAYAILAQSAGAVTVTSTGNIATAGSGAQGIAADGSGAGAVSLTSIGNVATTGATSNAIAAYATGGALTLSSTGNVSTAGGTSVGIYANGTGAGTVSVASTGNVTTAGTGAAYGIKAMGGTGAITVTSIGDISTAGVGARGIAVGAHGPGAVTVTSTGNITTAGASSTAILASNVAGGVTVTSTGNLTTSGNNAFGIYAGSTTGPVAVTIKSGTVSGGSGGGAGVAIAGGTNNTLTNMGSLMALSGLAIAGDTGNNTIDNFGTVTGNVELGTGGNAFDNMAGGLFNSGATAQLGAGNLLTNAGTLSPGGAGVIQTTALTGNLAQSTTGRLLIDINLATGTSDRINVSGTANLAGGVQLQISNLKFGAFQQTILSAAGGTTDNGLSLLPTSPVLQAQLVFPNATDVVVESAGINFVTPGLNNNQSAVGNSLNRAAPAAGLGAPIVNLLLNSTAAGYGPALTQLSGETATGSQQTTFDAMNMFMGAMTDPFNRGTVSTPGGGTSGYASEGAASGYASEGRERSDTARDAYAMFTKAPPQAFEARWSVWAAGFGGSQGTDGNTAVGSNSTTSTVAGTAVGADYRISPFTIAGFALAGGGTSFSVAGSGGGRSDLFQAGAYLRHDAGPAYITAALAYGWQDVITNRTVTLAGTDLLRAEFNANAFSGRLEGGYRFVAPWVGGVGITPYAAGQFTTFDLPAYAETALAGSGAFALSYGAKSVTDPRSEFGVRTDKSYAMPDGVLTLRGRLAWAHDYDQSRSIAATFQSLPGASFVVNGAAQASDSLLTTVAVEKKWLNGWSAAATFEGEFSNVTASYAGKGVVRYTW